MPKLSFDDVVVAARDGAHARLGASGAADAALPRGRRLARHLQIRPASPLQRSKPIEDRARRALPRSGPTHGEPARERRMLPSINQAMELTKIPKSDVINVFEVSAPQFAVLFKIFAKFICKVENIY